MFMWEGSILIATVVMGGGSLIFLSHRDQQRHEQLQTFFATFSHDIKTSITRLRLQAEVLEEQHASQRNPVLQRLVSDIARLDLQLENSLLLSADESSSLLKEKLLLSKLIESMRGLWAELEFRLAQDAEIIGDRRAITSVLKNLIQNAVLHGNASAVQFTPVGAGASTIEIEITDNGLGYNGDVKQLGQQILASKNEKGSGIGLYLGRKLMKRMNGNLHFKKDESNQRGLQAFLRIEGRVL
ncbi:MAG: HAMP domain-containing histidine kinase [Proteobacteria bacterium]|nr:MAG: HAMP domain-containing histidine kinase [Pseudomonadota bacterium]